VGANGSGKSTLVKLIARLYDDYDGEILINSISISDYDMTFLRSSIGVVLQDCMVFNVTIAENVLMREFANEKDEDIVKDALGQVGLLDKCLSLPNGIHTIIGREYSEDGAMLSGGEIQRLALARAFASDYRLLILDEPSSALDAYSEYVLFNKLRNKINNQTVIVISHQLDKIQFADRIIVLKDGEVSQVGTHKELINSSGEYAELYKTQQVNNDSK